ncbi:LysR family transcriptional regulator [Hamadaea tsunoensis]|uniref:LysR family transcriptional regulator n=1 Tax=Hamadaea tsunoensis TaxID=53368 RepID=UPI00054EAB12|nr:LysR family transcriptional regulator [Hamadaea tsunoensis]
MPLPPEVADLTSYDLLLSVARLGSLGRAAAEHGMSQPAASARLRQLERALGVQLLRRSPRGSTLTDAGALVVDWAQAVLDAAYTLATGAASLRSARHGRLRVAASQTVAEYLLPAWLVTLRSGRPELTVSLRAANTAQVVEAVHAGDADLGFIEGPQVAAGLRARDIAADRLLVVVAPGHPWTRRRRLGLGELAAAPLIMREQGSGTRAALLAALAAHGIGEVAEPLLQLSSTTAIKHAVAAGTGAAVLSSLAVSAELRTGALVAVDVPGLALERVLRAVWPTRQPPGGPAADLLAIATTRAGSRSTGSKLAR